MIYLSNHDFEDPEIIRGGYSRSSFLNGDYINPLRNQRKVAYTFKKYLKN